jgi:hypothetical protein
VLRLLDARTSSYAEVTQGRPGLLRVCGYPAARTPITALRVQLVADLLARVAELRGVQVLTALASTERSPGQDAAFRHEADALGIHPPAAHGSLQEAMASLGGPADVHIMSESSAVKPGAGGLVVVVGAARLHGGDDASGQTVSEVPGAQEHDPLAVRLALMSFPYQQPADLTQDVLVSARQALSHWRRQVAEWAESPSRPIPAVLAERAQAAFGDLDTVSVTGLLHGLAGDTEVPAGAKFETFVYADRILGLDLARDIGRLGG